MFFDTLRVFLVFTVLLLLVYGIIFIDKDSVLLQLAVSLILISASFAVLWAISEQIALIAWGIPLKQFLGL